jgi:tRNA A-37 threonylcarbamoyl transferase component Bud32
MSDKKNEVPTVALGASPRATTRGIPKEAINSQQTTRPGASVEEVPFFSGLVELLDDTPPPPVPTDGPKTANHRAVAAKDPAAKATQVPKLPKRRPVVGTRPWLEDRGEFARGGMSRLNRAYQQTLRRIDAMKILDQEAMTDLAARLRFIEEAQITGQLDHPNIPPIYDFWTDPAGDVQFTMKLVDGCTLKDRINEKQPGDRSERDWEALLRIFVKVCDALSFAHSKGVIHRDIKPDNIMVGAYGQVYLMDWGCVHLLPDAAERGISIEREGGTTLDPPQCILGTPAYMAPEQAWAEVSEIDERTDVYLMGAMLFEMLCGVPPHAGETVVEAVRSAQKGEVEHPQQVVGRDARLPPELCRIALQALSSSKDERYPSMEAMRLEIENALRVGWWFASQTFGDGELVVAHGEQAEAAYIITKGQCEVFRMHEGKRVVLRRLGPGEVFGETAILTEQQTRTASVAAVGEATTTVITKDAFDRAFEDSWLKPFVKALATRFRELDGRLATIEAAENKD